MVTPEPVEAAIRVAREILPAAHASTIVLIARTILRLHEIRYFDMGGAEVMDDVAAIPHVTPKDCWQPKDDRYRWAPISRAACEAEIEFIQILATVRLDDKATWNAIRKVRVKLTLPNFSVHELRRAGANALHAKGRR